VGFTAGPSLIGCDESMVQLTLLRRCQNVLPAIGREVAAAPIDDEPVAAPLAGPALCLWSLPMWPDYRCPCARAPAYTAITGARQARPSPVPPRGGTPEVTWLWSRLAIRASGVTRYST